MYVPISFYDHLFLTVHDRDRCRYLAATVTANERSRYGREPTVNGILQSFRTVDHIQRERFRPPNVPEYFMAVSERFGS